MIRKATINDIPAVAAIYDRIHTEEEQGRTTIGWIRSIYPTEETAKASLYNGDLFVLEENGEVLATGRINQEQVPEYANAAWEYEAPEDKIMVLHTLVVDPAAGKRGLGRQFVAFYEDYAKERGCPYLRMDTNATNLRARKFYSGLGFKEVGIVDCEFNGIPGVHLVCLEKYLGV